jgi:hypothetical protein
LLTKRKKKWPPKTFNLEEEEEEVDHDKIVVSRFRV